MDKKTVIALAVGIIAGHFSGQVASAEPGRDEFQFRVVQHDTAIHVLEAQVDALAHKVVALEKKVTHVVNILKLQRENKVKAVK